MERRRLVLRAGKMSANRRRAIGRVVGAGFRLPLLNRASAIRLKTILAPNRSQLVAHIAMRKAQPIHIHLFTKGDDFKQFAHFVLRG